MQRRHFWIVCGAVSGLFTSTIGLAQSGTKEQEKRGTVNGTKTWSIAIHGGAGGDPAKLTPAIIENKSKGLEAALNKGVSLLKQGGEAIDVAQAVVEILEDDPHFNAGRGSVFNNIGDVSLDASIMDGKDLSCGAVANATKARNPIRLARAIRDLTPHVLLAGPPADLFAEQSGIPLESQDYFKTEEQRANWEKWKERQANKQGATSRYEFDNPEERLFHFSTVGCVVRDADGNLAAATSTGGLLGKKFGRVGDSPIIGAGTYAKNKTCAVSCTGEGELFLKHHIASALSTRMEFLGESLGAAAKHEIEKTLPNDSGGIIAVDAKGNIEIHFNTPMMARGRATSEGLFQIGLVDWIEKK